MAILNPNLISTAMATVLSSAADIVKSYNTRVIYPEAVLLAMVRSNSGSLGAFQINRGLDIDRLERSVRMIGLMQRDMDGALDFVTTTNVRMSLSPQMIIALDEALSIAQAANQICVDTDQMLTVMFGLLRQYEPTPSAMADGLRSVPTYNSLRDFIVNIMLLTPEASAKYLAQLGDDSTIDSTKAFAQAILFSLGRSVKRREFEGWHHNFSPFADLDLHETSPVITSDILGSIYELNLFARAWLDIGIWRISEDYFKVALNLSLLTNDVYTALLLGANLSICYLLGQDTDSALRIADQVINPAIQVKDWTTVHRTSTVRRLCLAKNGLWKSVEHETKQIEAVNPDLASLDSEVLAIGVTAFKFMNATNKLMIWQQEWDALTQRMT